ncbi:WAT1-related protein At5g40240-like isoform X2 [Carica papaya]|uniref:WAT1-related protein At5g40240-like isoform X2 n=1 Tax=Carica papaya TaxID=3649 RepID=UPI000B8CD175|nr:WAT1-related protein At5g40240-like isoform X2 [Carica papaya]
MRKDVLAFVGMMMAECAQTGLMIAGKAAMSDGMSNFVFVFYSNALASLLLLPSSYIFYRSRRPPLTFPILCSFFILGFIGFLVQFIAYAGIFYSSPTLGTAMLNLIPGLTFILAVIFRMERLEWRSFSSIAKSVGTVLSITGAFIVTFYKGLPLLMTSSMSKSSRLLLLQLSEWVTGGLLLAISCVLASAWLIIQAVFGSAFQVTVSAWCLHQTGPVFVSMFKPLGIIIAVAVGVIFSGDTFYLGR